MLICLSWVNLYQRCEGLQIKPVATQLQFATGRAMATKKPVKPLPVATVVPEPEIDPEPAAVVSMEALAGSGDSVTSEVVSEEVIAEVPAGSVVEVDPITKVIHITSDAAATAPLDTFNEANVTISVGTDTTPVVPATAEKLVFCDPPGVWMKA